MGEVPCLHVEVTGQLAWIDSSLWVLESIQLDILRGKIPWPTEPPSCLTLFFNYCMLIIHNNGFMTFSCMDIIYFSHVHPLPSLVLPLLLTCFLFHPAHYCRVCVCGCVGVCVTYWVSLGWETKVYDVNFMTYSTQLNFKYILNN